MNSATEPGSWWIDARVALLCHRTEARNSRSFGSDILVPDVADAAIRSDFKA